MNDWDSLRYVLAVHRSGGLSGAARALGVNHATVSRQLDRAEAELGQKLFERLASGLVATEAGERTAEHAGRIEAEMMALDLHLAARGEDAGEIAVTVSPLMVTNELARDFCDFKALHPNTDLRVLGDNRVLNLHRREADVAIRVTGTPAESLWGRKVAEQRSGVFCAQDFAAPEEGLKMPVIAFTAWQEVLPAEITARFPEIEIVATCDDMVAAMALVRAGLGVTRMPCFLGDGQGFRRLPGQALQPYPPVWLLTHPDLRKTPRIRRFMAFVAERFSARAGLYDGRGVEEDQPTRTPTR